MSVDDLVSLNKQLKAVQRIYDGVEAQVTIPTEPKIKLLMEAMVRAYKSGMDMTNVWDAIRTTIMAAALARIGALQEEIVAAAQEIISDGEGDDGGTGSEE